MFLFLNLLPSEVITAQPATEIVAPINIQKEKVKIAQETEGNREILEIELPTAPNISPEDTTVPIDRVEVVEVVADRQEYDQARGVITAEGNVVLRFSQAVLTSDRMQVNLSDRLVVAEGNVVLTRGAQILEGEKFEYYLVQDRGVVINAEGQIDQETIDRDFSQQLPEDDTLTNLSLSDRLTANQPLTDVRAESEIEFSVGSDRANYLFREQRVNNPNAEPGTIKQVRFEAERLEFEPKSWQATNISLTNDPFSPPELELRANTANFQQIAPLVSRLSTTKSRVVIDNGLSVPLLRNSFLIDGRPRNPALFRFGFDGDERGGLFIERTFSLIDQNQTSWTVTPQYFIQRALFPEAFDFNQGEDGGVVDPGVFGLKSKFDTNLTDRSIINAKASVSGFDDQIDDNIRAKLAARQLVGNLANPYDFSLEYNFRERLFNGSLGFQTVYSSIGGIVTSPNISLGKTGIGLRYQASIQNINADTDRLDLQDSNGRTNLTRFQGAAFLGKGFRLWQGKALAISRKEALRYSPVPVIPYLQLGTGLSGVTSFYSNDDGQHSLRASIGIQGQFGHFSRSWLDYTGFNATYSIGTNVEESPFLFDRDADQQTLALGITQQLYGPIRVGVQTSFNIDNGDQISTDYVIEYSRRTHNITLRYSPELEIGSFSFRINDFNWRGNAEPFNSNDIRPVTQGVSR